MRVLVVAGLFPPATGARAEQAGRLVDALRARGIDVRVCSVRGSRGASYSAAVRGLGARMLTKLANFAAGCGVALNSAYIVALTRSWMDVSCDSLWRPDIVLSLSTPVESHTIGAYLAKKYICKWAVFFSDPWPLGLAPAPYKNSSAFNDIAKHGLRRSLKNADLVVAPTREVATIMTDYYWSGLRIKSFEILHCAPATSASGLLVKTGTLVHAGDLTRERCSAEFIEGVRQVCMSISSVQPLFHFIGAVDALFSNALQAEISGGKIKLTKRMPINECLAECARSSAVLIVEADMNGSPFLPSKVADYSSLGVPVLAVTNEDSALVRVCGGSVGFEWVSHERGGVRDSCMSLIRASSTEAFAAPSFGSDAVASRLIGEFRKLLAN